MRVDLDMIDVQDKAINMISKELCQQYNIFPYEIENKRIFLASFEDMKNENKLELEFLLKLQVKISICTKEQFFKYFSQYYEENYRRKVAGKVKEKKNLIYVKDQEPVTSPVSQLVESLMKEGVYKGASDIHIEPLNDKIVVRLRIDGILKNYSTLPKQVYEGIVSRIKVLGNMDIGVKYIPQDGEISIKIGGDIYDFRVSTLPTIYGEKCVLRVLKKDNNLLNLEHIGFKEKDYLTLRNLLGFKQGLIIVTGATGSGKTTTLYSMLNEVNCEEKNIISIEKPVECQIKGINQVIVGGLGKNSYESIVKTVLRQDPDVIMIGEILDKSTAEVAINASLTGHLVLTTLHTNDASSTVSRLKNMGIDPELIKDSLILVIAQKLTRKICDNCRERYELSNKEKMLLDLEGLAYGYRGTGCPKCNYTGYSGRIIVYEMMITNKKIKDIIAVADSETIRERAIGEGMTSIDSYFKNLIEEGITTTKEYYSNMQIYNVEKAIGTDYGI